jgi:hypothetical protein
LVRGSKLEGQVIFTGFIAYDDIPQYLSLANVGINPMIISAVSNYALPNKVLQYLQLGLPVVSTDLMGLRSALPEEPLIKWATGADSVLQGCCAIEAKSEKFGMNPRKNSTSMEKFAPDIAISSLEASLLNAICQ